jgi:hypothetical protein
MTINMHIFE